MANSPLIGAPPRVLRDVMRPSPPQLPSGATLEAARRALHIADCDRVLVMDGERLIGAVTESDLLRRVGEEKDCRCRPLMEVVGCDVATLSVDESIDVAAALFRTGSRRLLVLLEDGKVVGSVRPRDVMISSSGGMETAPHVGTLLSSSANNSRRETATTV